MTLPGAIKTCFAKSFVWEGRASRSEFWWFTLTTVVAYFAATLVGVASPTLGTVLALIVIFGCLLPSIAVTVRRLHDTDRSGGWYWITVVPIIGLILLLFLAQRGTSGLNRYGAPDDWDPTSVGTTDSAGPRLAAVPPGKHWCENIGCRRYRVSVDSESCIDCGQPTMSRH